MEKSEKLKFNKNFQKTQKKPLKILLQQNSQIRLKFLQKF